jgi:hypothetical protein
MEDAAGSRKPDVQRISNVINENLDFHKGYLNLGSTIRFGHGNAALKPYSN